MDPLRFRLPTTLRSRNDPILYMVGFPIPFSIALRSIFRRHLALTPIPFLQSRRRRFDVTLVTASYGDERFQPKHTVFLCKYRNAVGTSTIEHDGYRAHIRAQIRTDRFLTRRGGVQVSLTQACLSIPVYEVRTLEPKTNPAKRDASHKNSQLNPQKQIHELTKLRRH